jgi:iron complex outermembrane receptor protein
MQKRGFGYSLIPVFAAFICVAAGLKAARAEEMLLSLLTESEYLGEVPTIVTASRMPQLQSEAPAAVTVIDSEMIRASGARNIVDLLRFVPGFQIGSFNSSQPVVTYHGLADQYPRHMQVLVDGRSVYSPIFRGAFWSDLSIDIDDIERIEVIRGPNSVTYGSNAFFGVINIITRDISQQQGFYIKGAAGNNGIRDATARYAWRTGEQNFRLTGGWREDSGFETRSDDVQAKYLNFTGDLRFSQRDTLEIDLGVNENSYIEDFSETDLPISPTARDVISNYQQLRWRNAAGQSQEFSIQLFHNHREQKLEVVTDPILVPPLGEIEAPLAYNAIEDRYDFEFQHNVQASDPLQLVWGLGTRLDEMQSVTFFGDSQVRENRVHRLFSNIEWHVTEKLIINTGAIYEDSDVAGRDVSPRLAVNYHLSWGDTVRASISRATRMPSLVEQEGNQRFTYNHEIFGEILFDQNILGIGGLVTEKITTKEIAYLGRVNSINLTWGLRFYRDLIHNRITEIRIPIVELSLEGETFTFVNNGEVRVDGVELEADYKPTEKWRILFNYARMDAEVYGFNPGYSFAQRDTTIERSVPEYSVNGTAVYQFIPQWQTSIMAGRVATMEWLGDGDYIGGQNRVDLNLVRQFLGTDSVSSLALTVQWAGGKYTDFRYENITDTRYFVTYDTQF